MFSEEKITRIITLTLNEEEARWLKGVMQNPLYDHESKEDEKMRGALFHALPANLFS